MTSSRLPVSPFRPDVLSGRVVLITGGATGIGYGIANAFGAHGCKVAITSRRKPVIEAAVEELRSKGIDAFGVQGDVRSYESCVAGAKAVFDHFGRIDFLVNNAAGNFMVSAEDLTPNGLATVLGIDLQGMFHMSRSCLPYFKVTGPSDGAVILNITATLQDYATPFQGHAAAAKAGIDVMTNTMGVEWAEYGVRTVGLAPGGISGTVGGPNGRVFGNNRNNASNNSKGTVAEEQPDPEQLRQMGVPAGRWGVVDDVALAAVYMCTDAAAWITGTRLTIDGGSVHKVSNFTRAKKEIARVSAEQKKQFKGGVAKL